MSKKKAPTPEFSWLKPYLGGMTGSGSKPTSPSAGDHNQNSQIFTIEGSSSSVCTTEDLLGIASDSGISSDAGSSITGSTFSVSDAVVHEKKDNNPPFKSEEDRFPPESSVEVGVDVATALEGRIHDDVDNLQINDITLESKTSGQSQFFVSTFIRNFYLLHEL